MKTLKSFLLSLLLFSFASPAYAVCPLCVVAVGAGFGFSRWLGVDDIISSLWIGALLVALSMWTLIGLKKKNWSFKYAEIAVPLAFYALTLVPLYYMDILGHPLNRIWGIDKILFGFVLGTAVFLSAVKLHDYLKYKNSGKSYFPYQKIVFPLIILIITSLILWIII